MLWKMSGQTLRGLLVGWVTVVLLAACEADKPEGVIGQRTMEDLLYDYHLAQSLGRNHGDSTQYYTSLYQNAVFSKYGVTEVQFDESMEWYTRHSEELYDIYKHINERLAVSISSGSASNPYMSMTEGGDTANVWQGGSFYLLSSQGHNYMTFMQEADTSYHAYDRLMLRFDAQWAYREGLKQAVASLAVTYANDSVAAVTQYLSPRGPQEFTLQTDSMPVKSVSGFVYQVAEWAERPKFLILSNVCLIRFRSAQSPDTLKLQQEALQPERPLTPPRTAEQRIRDSLLRQDTLLRHPAPRNVPTLTTRRLRRTPR